MGFSCLKTAYFWSLVHYVSTSQIKHCHCYSMDETNKCHCDGVIDLPQNYLDGKPSTLSITNAQMKKLSASSFVGNSSGLVELLITNSNSLSIIESEVFMGMQSLKHLKVTHTSLSELPKVSLGMEQSMNIIDFESNKIQYIPSNSAKVRTEQFFLDYNKLKRVDGWAFNGSQIAKLSLKGNLELKELSIDAFSGIESLRDLDLSDTSITFLPVNGLEELEILRIVDTYSLRTIPSIYDLSSLQTALLTYSFHCCAFHNPEKHDPFKHQEYMLLRNELCKQEGSRSERDMYEGFGEIFELSTQDPTALYPCNELNCNETKEDGIFHQLHKEVSSRKIKAVCGTLTTRFVSCLPMPDALNPCEDMMSWVWLRVSVWVVLSTAIIGNLAVLTVLCLSKTEKSVPRFLMCNLAFADLITAIYLLMLAIMDIISCKTYFNYAFEWQRGYGCKVAGFLTVFSSQLSLFTLSLLTIERWFAIRHALYLNMLDFRIASNIMICGWIYSVIMALLPLIGVSSYSKTSICLPMESKSYISQAYIIFMILIGGAAFLLMCICYTQIYFSLSHETRNSISEGTIARKMTILVGTNFLCWAPVAFFSFTALAGYPLISISQSKILLVFIYPINSCANPYLYAILTKQYRKDFIAVFSKYIINKGYNKHKKGYSRPTSNDIPGQQTTAETLL